MIIFAISMYSSLFFNGTDAIPIVYCSFLPKVPIFNVIYKRYLVYAAFRLIPTLWTTPNFNSWSLSRQCANFPVASSKFSIHRNAPWSVLTMNILPSKYSRSINTAQKTAKHSRCVVTCSIFAFFNYLYQNPIGRAILSVCSWKKTHPTF